MRKITSLAGFLCLLPGLAQATDTQINIVGGTPAKEVYPWMVSLHVGNIKEAKDLDSQYCGGALIDKRWVLTAAHCVQDMRDQDIWATVGATELNPELENERIRADAILVHPKFSWDDLSNDVALVRLSKDSTKTPIKTLSKASSATIPEGELVKAMGWGARQDDSTDLEKLYEVDLVYQSREACEAAYPDKIDAGMICAGFPEGGKDSCQGDSGGPLVVRRGGEYYHFGIVSWGYGCAQPEKFGVYTETGKMAHWLDEVRSGIAVVERHQPKFLGEHQPYTISFRVTNHSKEPKAIQYSNVMSFAQVDRIRNHCQRKVLKPYEVCDISMRITPGAARAFDNLSTLGTIEDPLSLTLGAFWPEVHKTSYDLGLVTLARLPMVQPLEFGLPLYTNTANPWHESVEEVAVDVEGSETGEAEESAADSIEVTEEQTVLAGGLASSDLPSILSTQVEGPGEFFFDIEVPGFGEKVTVYDNGFPLGSIDFFTASSWLSTSFRVGNGSHMIRFEVQNTSVSLLETSAKLRKLSFVPDLLD